MFERPPHEKEWASWFLLGLWSLTIFAAIPLARTIRDLVSERWGRQTFAYLTVTVIAATTLAAVWFLIRQRRTPASYVWLAAVGIIYGAYIHHLRHAPEEAFHFVQYGVLGVLGYRALSHRVRDWTIYLTVATVGAVVGVLDELIQWLTPGRYWGIQDIWIDFLGTALAQVGIARGLRPAIISGPASVLGIRWLCRSGMALSLTLGATLLNTPPRIAWYAERVPGLSFLKTNESVMFEYGHRFTDPETGPFRSRLSREELRRTDRERGAEAAAVLDRFRDRSRYREFLSIYTPVSDPFLHEARVHLFRRDQHLAWATDPESALYETPIHLAVAFRENRIMERYFPTTLSRSSYSLGAEQLVRLRESALPDKAMPAREVESRVGRRLLTALGERHVLSLLTLVALALLFTERRYRHAPDLLSGSGARGRSDPE